MKYKSFGKNNYIFDFKRKIDVYYYFAGPRIAVLFPALLILSASENSPQISCVRPN
jgi:hypothetical protein